MRTSDSDKRQDWHDSASAVLEQVEQAIREQKDLLRRIDQLLGESV